MEKTTTKKHTDRRCFLCGMPSYGIALIRDKRGLRHDTHCPEDIPAASPLIGSAPGANAIKTIVLQTAIERAWQFLHDTKDSEKTLYGILDDATDKALKQVLVAAQLQADILADRK